MYATSTLRKEARHYTYANSKPGGQHDLSFLDSPRYCKTSALSNENAADQEQQKGSDEKEDAIHSTESRSVVEESVHLVKPFQLHTFVAGIILTFLFQIPLRLPVIFAVFFAIPYTYSAFHTSPCDSESASDIGSGSGSIACTEDFLERRDSITSARSNASTQQDIPSKPQRVGRSGKNSQRRNQSLNKRLNNTPATQGPPRPPVRPSGFGSLVPSPFTDGPLDPYGRLSTRAQSSKYHPRRSLREALADTIPRLWSSLIASASWIFDHTKWFLAVTLGQYVYGWYTGGQAGDLIDHVRSLFPGVAEFWYDWGVGLGKVVCTLGKVLARAVWGGVGVVGNAILGLLVSTSSYQQHSVGSRGAELSWKDLSAEQMTGG